MACLERGDVRAFPKGVPKGHGLTPVSNGAVRVLLSDLLESLVGGRVLEGVQQRHAFLKRLLNAGRARGWKWTCPRWPPPAASAPPAWLCSWPARSTAPVRALVRRAEIKPRLRNRMGHFPSVEPNTWPDGRSIEAPLGVKPRLAS